MMLMLILQSVVLCRHVMTVWPVIQTCLGVSRVLATPPRVLATQIRWAGHNKWSNIRHIKAEKDGLAAKVSL